MTDSVRGPGHELRRLSVVIANYNYERYVGAAIDSALAIDWPDVEVVVVDDGSTDGSLAVIRDFGDRLRLLATENGGQREAVNRGFAVSTGDVVVFLDADDVLPAELARHLERAWHATASKAQFRMQRIDADGIAHGKPFPRYHPAPTPRQIRMWAQRTSAYPTPPGSGNAYARWFLERVMPVGAECGDAADSALLAAAPFLGDVLTVPDVVVGYRRHGGNDSDLLRDRSRFPREVERARSRWLFARRAAVNEAGKAVAGDARDDARDDAVLRASRELLQLRVASWRLVPGARPLPGDSAARMMRDAVLSPWRPGPESAMQRLAVASWCLATLCAPTSVAERLVVMRYGRSS